MYINRVILGKRLKTIRKSLNITQSKLVKELNLSQNIISLIESGKTGSIDSVLTLINYYSDYNMVDKIFSKEYELEVIDTKIEKEIIIEKIKLVKEKFENEMNDLIDTI